MHNIFEAVPRLQLSKRRIEARCIWLPHQKHTIECLNKFSLYAVYRVIVAARI